MFHAVALSELAVGNKALLHFLIVCWNQETGKLNPGVAKLSAARGIENAKNFKGVDKYLPGLVTVHKSPGFGNSYSLNIQMILELPPMKVATDKYRNNPSVEGVNSSNSTTPLHRKGTPPSQEGYYPPSQEGYYPPSQEGSERKEESKDRKKNENGIDQGVTYVDQEEVLADTKSSLVEEVLSSGESKRVLTEEIEILGILGPSLVDEVTANAAPSVFPLVKTNVLDDLEDLVVSSGSQGVNEVDLDKVEVTPGKTKKTRAYSWVVKKKDELSNVNEVDLGKSDATDASLSATGAEDEAKVKEIPAKPERPLYVDPNRSPYDDDDDYEDRRGRAFKAYVKYTMPGYTQRLSDWEKKYGNQPLLPMSPGAQALQAGHTKIQKHNY